MHTTTHNDFIAAIKIHGLIDYIDLTATGDNTPKLYNIMNEQITTGCHLVNKKTISETYQDIDVKQIVGQVGRFNNCNELTCCCDPGYNFSTWISACRRGTFYDNLTKLQNNPEYYFNQIIEANDPLAFYTEDNKLFYSTGCSTRAIIAKLLLTMYEDVVGTTSLLKNVKIITKI